MIYPLAWILSITLYWFLIGTSGSLILRRMPHTLPVFFLLSTLGSLVLLFVSSMAFNQPSSTLTLSLGIPGFPFYFHWDTLSAFFILLLSAASIGVGLFASQYFKHTPNKAKSILCFYYHLFLPSMVWVFIAADAYSFLIAWELMTLASYFLIVGINSTSETRRAGFLYFLMAHLGAIAILFSFAVMLPDYTHFTFSAMRQVSLSPFYASIAFGLALIGFGAKAGLIPLHLWLPEAHPAAPSPVSALMSGVMLKTAIYGLIRVIFDLLGSQEIGWGLIVTIVGILTTLLGAILATMQTDMKRLLAYSSIDNIGIITTATGLALLLNTLHQTVLAALALSAALFHCFNHALFKSLLFLGTGSVLHATGERNLGKLGGLIKRMPWVTALVLLGTLAIAGVPPLNGFVSEWLLIQSFLFFPPIQMPYIALLIPVAAALFVLAIGLTAFVMVKFFGIIFLGKPRESELSHACDAGILERIGLGWLAILCVLLGFFPFLLMRMLTQLTHQLLGQSISSAASSWIFLAPASAARASYSPFLLFCIMGLIFAAVYFGIRRLYHGRLRRAIPWDCGYPQQTPRMQDTAEGFGQPIKILFAQFIHIRLETPTAFDQHPHFRMQAEDRFWHILYFPLVRGITWIAKKITYLQRGRISVYLLYSFLTLLILLWWVS